MNAAWRALTDSRVSGADNRTFFLFLLLLFEFAALHFLASFFLDLDSVLWLSLPVPVQYRRGWMDPVAARSWSASSVPNFVNTARLR